MLGKGILTAKGCKDFPCMEELVEDPCVCEYPVFLYDL